jgi:hypothetical protein
MVQLVSVPAATAAAVAPAPRCTRAVLLARRHALLSLVSLPLAARAAESWSVPVVVSLSEPAELLAANAALYVTLRPTDGAAPLAAKRLPLLGVSFPLELLLTEADELPGAPPLSSWEKVGLLVSGRLDSDGVAATRSPDDLVGRAAVGGRGAQRPASQLSLRGRGFGGRLVTQRS